jgi:hypothetical protein
MYKRRLHRQILGYIAILYFISCFLAQMTGAQSVPMRFGEFGGGATAAGL